jgi:hypothetical protein
MTQTDRSERSRARHPSRGHFAEVHVPVIAGPVSRVRGWCHAAPQRSRYAIRCDGRTCNCQHGHDGHRPRHDSHASKAPLRDRLPQSIVLRRATAGDSWVDHLETIGRCPMVRPRARESRSRRCRRPLLPVIRGCRTNRTGCPNMTRANFADLMGAAQAGERVLRDESGSPPESSPCRKRTKTETRDGLCDSRASRTSIGGLCRKVFVRRCCARDGGLLALQRRPSGAGAKPPRAALAEHCCGERSGKRRA